jgi:hypothetical protein
MGKPIRAEGQMSIELALGVFLAFALGYALRAYMSYRRRHYR